MVSTDVEFPQHDIQLAPAPRLALTHVLGSHSLGPQREVLGRILPHVGSVAGMISQLLERSVHCYRIFSIRRYLD